MRIANELEGLSERKVYPFKRWYLNILLVLAIGLIPLIAVAWNKIALHQSLSTGINGVLIVFSLLILLLGIPAIFAWRNVRLIVSPEGLVYCGPNYNLYTPWYNIAGRTVQYGYRTSVDALQLDQPAMRMSLQQGIEQHQPALEKTERRILWGGINYKRTTVIPVGYFMWNWQEGGLIQDIQHYAPQAFAHKLPPHGNVLNRFGAALGRRMWIP